MNVNSAMRTPTARTRTVIVHGSSVKVCAARPRNHKGGGIRGKQHGHTRRSELRLHDYLSTCQPADLVIWLTYPDSRGPNGVKNHIDAFIRRLEKHVGRKVAALIKMETQQRLSPELGILVWNLGGAHVDTGMVERWWSEAIRAAGRVKVEPVNDWVRLASYVSKRVAVNESEILIGSKRYPHSKSEPADSNFIKRAHNPEIPTQTEKPFSNPYVLSMEYMQAKREWLDYTGRFHWKRQEKLIPGHDKVVLQVQEEQLTPMRGQINANRVRHFIGINDSMTLRGVDALRAAKELGVHANVGHSEISAPKRSADFPRSSTPVPNDGGQADLPYTSTGLRQNHGTDRTCATVRESGYATYFASPLVLPPLYYTGEPAAYLLSASVPAEVSGYDSRLEFYCPMGEASQCGGVKSPAGVWPAKPVGFPSLSAADRQRGCKPVLK